MFRLLKGNQSVRGAEATPASARERLREAQEARRRAVEAQERRDALFNAEVRYHVLKEASEEALRSNFSMFLRHLSGARAARIEAIEADLQAALDDVQRAQETLTAYASDDAYALPFVEATQRLNAAIGDVIAEEISACAAEVAAAEDAIVRAHGALAGFRLCAQRLQRTELFAKCAQAANPNKVLPLDLASAQAVSARRNRQNADYDRLREGCASLAEKLAFDADARIEWER